MGGEKAVIIRQAMFGVLPLPQRHSAFVDHEFEGVFDVVEPAQCLIRRADTRFENGKREEQAAANTCRDQSRHLRNDSGNGKRQGFQHGFFIWLVVRA